MFVRDVKKAKSHADSIQHTVAKNNPIGVRTAAIIVKPILY